MFLHFIDSQIPMDLSRDSVMVGSRFSRLPYYDYYFPYSYFVKLPEKLLENKEDYLLDLYHMREERAAIGYNRKVTRPGLFGTLWCCSLERYRVPGQLLTLLMKKAGTKNTGRVRIGGDLLLSDKL